MVVQYFFDKCIVVNIVVIIVQFMCIVDYIEGCYCIIQIIFLNVSFCIDQDQFFVVDDIDWSEGRFVQGCFVCIIQFILRSGIYLWVEF